MSVNLKDSSKSDIFLDTKKAAILIQQVAQKGSVHRCLEFPS